MEITNNIILQLIDLVFILSLVFYLLQNLQWYNYSLSRTLIKHSKPYWHIIFLVIPIICYIVLKNYFYIYLIIHLILLGIWYYKLDKKLVWTTRVIRFFSILAIFLALNFIIAINIDISKYFIFVAAIIAFITSYISEIVVMKQYKKLAKEKLDSMPDLKIIAVTASYGKTSIKNFIFELLSKQYKTYATPRSINTINGIISDINNNLESDTQIYIVEAGARNIGDIAKISKLINHHYAIIGEIGDAHLQYFKTIENIKNTKYELLLSNRLKEAFLYKDNDEPSADINISNAKILRFPTEIKNVESNLDATSFDLKIDSEFYSFQTKILGRFNISNISVAILLAHHNFRIDIKDIQIKVQNLKQVEHRLEKLEVNRKIILDDSFNGNLKGMSEAIRLSSLYKNGKKIIVTPGLIESSEENNIKLANLINEVFDIAIITGELNSKILAQNITKAQKMVIKDKVNLQNILSSFCKDNDLVLFANDAPNYI